VNVHTEFCCLVHAGIEVSSHDPLWNYTDVLSSIVISVGSKGHTTLMCGLISFDLGSD
jgi:hypothetical protein